MILCPNCCNIMEDDAIICTFCGTVLQEPETVEEAPEKEAPEKEPFFKKIPKKVKIITPIAVAVILVVTILLTTIGNLKPQYSHTLYVKDRELFFTDNKTASPVRITTQLVDLANILDDNIYDSDFSTEVDILDSYCTLSKDGKTLFFPDYLTDIMGGFSLYYLKPHDKNAKAKLIDKSVKTYVVDEACKYVTYIAGSDKTLYQSNLDKKGKIDTNVSEFVTSKDGKEIIYLKYSGEIFYYKQNKAKEMVAYNPESFTIVNHDINSVYFQKNNDLFKIEKGGELKTIASDVLEVVKYYDSGEIYYLKSQSEPLKYEDYLEDDMKETDEKMQRPQFVPYPSRWDYASDEEYDKALEDYDDVYSAYEEASSQWTQKANRETIRSEIEYETFDVGLNTLCYYDGKKEKKLSENTLLVQYSAIAQEKPALIFLTADFSKLKKVKISEIDGIAAMRAKLEQQIADFTVTELALEGSTSVIGFAENRDYFISPDAKVVYFIDDLDDSRNSGNLYEMKIVGKKPREPKFYDSQVLVYPPIVTEDGVFYYKNYDAIASDVYFNKKLAAEGVLMYSVKFSETLDAFVYLKNWDYTLQYGELEILQNGKTTTIDDSVGLFNFNSAGEVVYLKNYDFDSNSGELFTYTNGKKNKIDEGVMRIVPRNTIENFTHGSTGDILIN